MATYLFKPPQEVQAEDGGRPDFGKPSKYADFEVIDWLTVDGQLL